MKELSLDIGVGVSLGGVVARAGEGTVYEVVGRPEWVVKLFHSDLGDLAAKVEKVAAMVGVSPPGAVQPDGFVVLTWPVHVVSDDAGVVGYVMSRVDTGNAVEIHSISNPSNRAEPLPTAPQWTRGVTWMHLVNIAANLCLAVEAVHRVNAVIGDFQERNILVADTTQVTLVDCDSMQFTDASGRQFLCGVGRPEFTAPELASVNLRERARERSSDLFALAVHIHLLLMAGNHPFMRGTWIGVGDQPDALTLAQSGSWAGAPGSLLARHPLAPSVTFLPEEVQRLFARAFTEGARDPSARPSAVEWREALLRIQMVTCPRGIHQMPAEADPCPWCAIDDERVTRRHQRAASTASRPDPQVVYKVTAPPPDPYRATAQAATAVAASSKPFSRAALITLSVVLGIAVITTLIALIVSQSSDDVTATTQTSTSRYTSVNPTGIPGGGVLSALEPASTPPPGAVECSSAGRGRYGHAARGNEVTSCPFAEAVLAQANASANITAYRDDTVTAFSPVTNKSYPMSCRVERVMTCRGGNDAVVYVY
nr:hypothetical protein [Mycobacterium sp. 141]